MYILQVKKLAIQISTSNVKYTKNAQKRKINKDDKTEMTVIFERCFFIMKNPLVRFFPVSVIIGCTVPEIAK